MANHLRPIAVTLLCTVMVFLLPTLVSAGASFPVPHTPKPSGPYIEFHAPDAYPFTYRGWFNVSIETNFRIPPGEFDTPANVERNTPFRPFTKDKNVFMYFGPNKLGSVQLLNQGGCRLTPDKQVWTPYDLGSRLDFWHWRYEFDWSLVNYWYSVAISWATYCWPGGCWTSSDGKSSYCWSGGCTTYATDWNYYEVYYWTKGSFLRKVKQPEFRVFPIRMEIGRYWDPIKRVWVKIYKYYNSPETGEFTRVTPVGLADHSYNFTAEIMNFVFRWYQYTYSNPLKKVSHSLQSYVHPLPPTDPVWSMTADNIWRDKIDDTKVKLNFRWGKPSPNRNEEQYYIEYGKLFDGKIKMRDVVKLLSNLGYDQVDVPIYMAIESAEPKLYLVTTPRLVKGARKAPAPYTPIPQSQWLSHSGVVPGYTLHPSAEAFGRGYIRECIKPYVFENGKPKAGPVKYIFSKMFDINCDGNIDSIDRAFLERGLKIADFNEDGNADTGDCASIWHHSFGNFPRAFEKLAAEVRLAFARDPRLLDKSSTVYATAGPVAIEEVSYNVDGRVTGRVAHIQIGWWGNAFTGQFTVTPVPGSPSKKFPFAPTGVSYTARTDPGVTGANFLPNLGPMPFPSRVEDASRFPELYRSDTAERADGTLLGRLKRAAVIAYKKCDMSGKHCYPVGDPWGIGLLESIESGVMGQLPLYGDVDGKDGFNQADLDKWDEVKKMEGFILSSVWQHPIGVAIGKPVVTDLNREFRVVAGGKFSAYPPAGATSFVLKESYNYRFLDPVIWAYDAREGNQMSFGRRFRLDGGGGDPGGPPPPPPYPPTQTKRLPTKILGPDDIPEDIPQTWTAPGVEEVVIKPDTWEQKWSVSPGGAAGSGESFTSEFKLAGRYTITHTVKYTQRIVTPVTDSLGIIVYYAVTDIPQTRTLTLDIVVFDHEISEFEDPKFELKGPGNSATYARQWGSDAASLRTRDFPSALKAYPETMAVDTRSAGVPSMHDNNWLTVTTRENGKEYRDHHFDIVNADPSKMYDFTTMLEMRFARKVTETSDLNLANVANADHLEAYSGVLLSAPITLKLEINQLLPDGGVRSYKTFTFTPDVSAKGEVEVDPANMGEYLIKVGDRYMKVQTAKFPAKFAWDLPVPTFPNEGYETVVTLTCTQRGYYLDHPSQTAKLKTRFGSAFSRLTLNGDGVIRYLDRDFTYTWRRKSLTVDVTPPSLTAFEEHDGLGAMVPVAGGVIHGTTGDQTRFRFATSDNHPAYGPNDGLKDGGTRRVWYPRFWLQAIDGRRGQFTALATEGFELPLIVPNLRDKLSTSPDGNLAADLTAFTKERVDGHHLSVVAPADLETIGTRGVREMTIQQQFSNYIAGKIKYVLEVEDGSRNYVRQEGWFQVVDNKRPNLDLRLATAKYKPLPDDGSLAAISDILTQVPLGPAVSPHGLLGWSGVSPDAAVLADRTRAAKNGLLVAWRHPYNDPDLVFAAGGAFTSRFTAPGHVYQREANLDEVRDNLPITETNTSKWDDQVIRLGDRDIKAAFQVANPGEPGFAEDEVVVLDLSVRDNLLFWQDDSLAPNGRVVADHAFRKIAYEFLQNVTDERKVAYRDELAVEVVRNPDDTAPLRLLNADGTALSYIFRVGNADAATGLRNPGTGANTGSNTFRLETLDLTNNRRDLEIDFPIVPSRFQIRILETDIQADRKK